MSKIPNNIHIIYGLSKTFGWGEYEHFVGEIGKTIKRPKADVFNIMRYLAIKSAYEVNKPDNIFFYYHYEPYGEWWERAKQYITPIKVDVPKEIFGNPVKSYAHQADIIRLQILIEDGGIYLDSDTLCLKPFKPLLDEDKFIIGQEGYNSTKLCNAVMLSPKDSEFAKIWLSNYTDFDDNNWAGHSIELPYKLSQKHPDLVHIMNYKSFTWPLYHSEHLRWFFRNGVSYAECDYSDGIVSNMGGTLRTDEDFSESYVIHLWAGKSVTNEFVKDFPNNPMEDWMTVDNIRNIDTPFNKLARQFLEDL